MHVIHWFRADLRLADNTALARAAQRADRIAFLFVLDPQLARPERVGARRLRFLRGSLESLRAELARRGHALHVRPGDPRAVVPSFAREAGAQCVAWNRDTTPFARARDAAVAAALERAGLGVLAPKDRVVFEGAELRTGAGRGYQVFTPFKRAWLARLRDGGVAAAAIPRLPAPLALAPAPDALGELPSGEASDALPAASEAAARRRLTRFCERGLGDYAQARDLPALDGTSRLSAHLRFGVLSPRACIAAARDAVRDSAARRAGALAWTSELIWRDFYAAILEEHPHVLRRAFRPAYDGVRWNDDEPGFAAWCRGQTGYPIVDAGMRQLAATGWMHNRARMLAASFLVKDLLIDWRRGERWFAAQLADGDPASNNGGWQWSASTGTDAQPYFRIFSPTAQGERFDPLGAYVRRWVPELRALPDALVHRPWEAPALAPDYPAPIVEHAQRRVLAVQRFEQARAEAAARGR